METKIDDVYLFLSNNRKFNKEVQTSFYRSVLLPYNTIEDKVISLLHFIANTQSQPKIDKLSVFFQDINNGKSKLKTFKGLLTLLGKHKESPSNYKTLFELLHKKEGWGKKTAALFTKSIYHLHNGKYDSQLKVWDDAPKLIDKNDQMFLPVDAVIEFIFKKLKFNGTINFNTINKYLSNNYKGNKIEVWDDLWFWGFITQKTEKGIRTQKWNEAKYWALLHTNKKERTIEEIKKNAIKFRALIK